MNNVVSMLKWMMIAFVVGALLYAANQRGYLDQPASPEVQISSDAMECVAAAMLVDAKGEAPGNIDDIRMLIAKAVRNYSIVNRTPVCEVFEKGLTMIPLGYVRSSFYLGRSRFFVKREFTEANWNAALVNAKKVLSLPIAQLGCETHYIRADRAWGEKEDALAAIRQMQPSTLSTGSMQLKLYCPKPATKV